MGVQELCKECDSSLKNVDARNDVCLDCIRQLVHIKDPIRFSFLKALFSGDFSYK